MADITPVLVRHGASDLAAWLSSETSPVELYGHLDVRDLTSSNARAFRDALVLAFHEIDERVPSDEADAKQWRGYFELFESLADYAARVARGENASMLRNLTAVPPHDGCRAGPGWHAET